jgi:Protein of unknown function (DUF2785).
MEEKQLMDRLIKIQKNNYILNEGESYYIYALEMINQIGSLDAYLRDDLIYGTFYIWISTSKYNHKELKELLEISLDKNHLFYKLEGKVQDAVFTRTFSALVIALIINEHRKENFIRYKDLIRVKSRSLEYMIMEKDLRGYVEESGWAHSIAHMADVLDELVQCEEICKVDLLEIIKVISDKICVGYYVYIDEESERLTNVIESILKMRVLNNHEIIDWLKKFKEKNNDESYIYNLHLKVNVKGFLRSLYFRLIEKEAFLEISEEIQKVLKEIEKK